MKKLLRYLVNIILFVVLWGIMFLAPMKYSIDMGATSIAAIGGIVAIIFSYKLVKRINKSNLWASLFDETELVNEVVEEKKVEVVEEKTKKKVEVDKKGEDEFVSKGNMRLLISINIIVSLFLLTIWHPFGYDLLYSFSFPVVFSIGYWLVLLIIRQIKIVNNQINPDLLKLIIIIGIPISFYSANFDKILNTNYNLSHIENLSAGFFGMILYLSIVLMFVWVGQGYKEE